MNSPKALLQTLHQLKQHVNTQHELIQHMLTSMEVNSSPSDMEVTFHKESREQILCMAILDTIEVLESTRKAFKSKQLEVHRKKLIEILANHA